MGVGRGTGGPRPSWILKISAKEFKKRSNWTSGVSAKKMQKMIQLDIRNRSRTKNPTPTPSVVRNPTRPKNLWLLKTQNPAPTSQPCSTLIKARSHNLSRLIEARRNERISFAQLAIDTLIVSTVCKTSRRLGKALSSPYSTINVRMSSGGYNFKLHGLIHVAA